MTSFIYLFIYSFPVNLQSLLNNSHFHPFQFLQLMKTFVVEMFCIDIDTVIALLFPATLLLERSHSLILV